MMKKYFSILALALFSMIFTGCATKRMVKQAGEFEFSGMYRQAADLYYRAVINKPGKTEYRMALQRSSSMHLQESSQEIKDAYTNGQYQKVVYDYLELESFVNRIKTTGVDLALDPEIKSIYSNSQNQFLEDEYNNGLRLLGEERFDEAKTVFTEIFRLNPSYKDTPAHLNTATLEPFYRSGLQNFTNRNYMAAWNDWKKVIDKDPDYRDTSELMQQALEERYKQGSLALLNEDFNLAQQALGDVARANASYKDVKSQLSTAINEPRYRRAKAEMESGNCRNAYMIFSEVLEYTNGNYRDASSLITDALQCAAYPIAIFSGSIPSHPSDDVEFTSSVIQNILEKNDPFVKVHSLSSIDMRIYRALSASSDRLNRSLLRALHDRHGIKAVLYIVYDDYSRKEGELQPTRKKGFVRTSYTTEDGTPTHRDRMVDYIEFSATSKINMSLRYQLISAETGEILLTQRLSKSEQSSVHYASFDGTNRELYPANFVNDNWIIDEERYSTLQNLLKAPRTLLPVNRLKENVFEPLSSSIANDVVQFNPERQTQY